MCVGFEATVLYEKGTFTGLKQKWTFFDERYTAEAIEGLDTNKDGKLDRAELDELAKVNVEGLKEYDYFAYAAQAGQAVKLGEPKDYWFEYADGALSLHFTLPFATAVPVGKQTLELAIRDTGYFIAFGLQKVPDSVRLGSGTPKGCRVAVALPEAEEQATTKQILDALGCPITVPKAISVACDDATPPQVDVAAILDRRAKEADQALNWRMSIVDLTKLLKLDSTRAARKALAKELKYAGDTKNSAAMNMWLHKQLMTKLAQGGGKLLSDAKH
jgi:ABC-type uncharacterized transport system substrate-binding protein